MKKEHIRRKATLLISFFVLFAAFAATIFHIGYLRVENEKEGARRFAASEEYKICYVIESRIITAKALEMYVLSRDGDISDFQEAAIFYYEDDPSIRSIQLAPGGVVTRENMYPQEDEDFTPHDLFADPERKDDAELSRDEDQVIISGPLELRQGGMGITIRNPIYLEEKGRKIFWGFSIVIFNVPEIFNIEQMNLLTNDYYDYRLWKYLPDSQESQVILENTDRELEGAVREDIEVVNDVWHLDIMPRDGWVPYSMMVVLALFFSVLMVLAMIAISSHLRVREVVYYDSLLDIGNGNGLSAVFKKLSPSALKNMYLVVFDIDKFKEFNYIYGEESGDRLLKYVVRTFQEEFPDICLFRYYSDFFITLDECEDHSEYERKINRLLSRFEQDIKRGEVQPFDISAGVRKIEEGESLQRIISDALIARGTIKGNHIRHYAFYNDDIRLMRVGYMEMESNFAKALREKEFCVYYQPKYDIRTGQIIGAEALTRWIQEDGTVISPRSFIPCFEESRQIILLDEYVLGEVCRQMKEMQKEGLEVCPVSVNLSRVHLRHRDILSKISAIIKETGIDPSNLSFEITESALLEDSIPMKAIVHHLHGLGCKVEMDDYGVGASNPDVLLSNNFDMLKLDKCFVDRIGDERTEDLIRSTTHLVMKWGMGILAEGVEEKYQAERLVELGCTYAQGFYYSKPVPEEEYRELLRSAAKGVRTAPAVPMSARSFSDDIRILLDGNLMPTYIVDPERFVVMYCNRALAKLVGEDPTGGLCYQKIRGRKEPCRSCSAMRLYRDGDDSPKEIRLPSGGWGLLQTSPLQWQGRRFVQITCVDITRQKQMEKELHLRSMEYEVIVRQSVTGVIRYDIAADTATVNVDRNLDRVEEYSVSDCIQTMRESGLVEPDSVPVVEAMLGDIHSGAPGKGYDIQLSLERDGMRWCRFDYALIRDEDGRPYRAVISFCDNTQQRERELAYERWNSGLAALINENIVYVEANLSKDVVEAENRFGSWNYDDCGRPYSALIERIEAEWVIPEHIRKFQEFFSRERILGRYYGGLRETRLEYQAMMEDGPQWIRAELQMASDPSGNDVKGSFVFKNVNDEVTEREKLKYEAERDSMTGLYNRSTVERLIREVMEQYTGERCCLLIIDLDDLRNINNSLGHLEGDRALECIANAMHAKFRKGDILGRVGGDEFVALLRNVPQADGLHASISDFMSRLRAIKIGPLNDRSVHVSVGGTIGTAGKVDFTTLYGQADRALYYTKVSGKNAFNFYVPEMESQEFLYQPRSTVTMTRTNWYESSEFRKLLKGMGAFFPLVISVNLTKNTYYMMEYMAYTNQKAKDEGSFDELIANGIETFHPEDRESFQECYLRENLLRAHKEGKRIVGHRGRQLGEDGLYHMVQTVVVFVEDDVSDDVCEVTFAHVMDV
ncbi:MAG: EAL domain-containing protein [Eubacteriales bacterium]|nr:EAL domain-containing protein [Eubacteriales bacterium]